MKNKMLTGRFPASVAASLMIITAGCGALRSNNSLQPSFYALDSILPVVQSVSKNPAPTLIINPPRASAGFDTARIIYVRDPHKLEYYSYSEWIDTPARMLAPLIITAIENSGSFRAVVLTPSAASGDVRLDTEIIRLQHELDSQPSRVHFTLRAYLVDNTTRRVLGWGQFDESIQVSSEDPYGSVIAANLAVQSVLSQLSVFCSDTLVNWQSGR